MSSPSSPSRARGPRGPYACRQHARQTTCSTDKKGGTRQGAQVAQGSCELKDKLRHQRHLPGVAPESRLGIIEVLVSWREVVQEALASGIKAEHIVHPQALSGIASGDKLRMVEEVARQSADVEFHPLRQVQVLINSEIQVVGGCRG